MKHTYENVEGTEPDVDEQHQPRTTKHFDDGELVQMMTEIGDGTFVAWTDCRACKKRVKDCACPGGPVEPEYMMKWRDQRFTHSFTRRHAPPALPEAIRTRDRLINAALRYLRGLEWTIEPPAQPVEEPDFEFDPTVDVEDEDEYVEPISGMEGEANDYAESLHSSELSDDERDHEETGPDGDARTYDPETGDKIESPVEPAPEPEPDRLARLQEGTYDAGF